MKKNFLFILYPKMQRKIFPINNISVKKINLLFFFFFSFSCLLSAQTLQRFEYIQPKMGTQFRLIFYTKNQSFADSVAAVAFARIDELNQIFSDYKANSEISLLSKNAPKKVKVSDELWEVLFLSKEISKKSKGAFDISIGTLSKLWRRAFRRSEFPKLYDITKATKLVNYRWIKLDKKTQSIRLKKTGMRLDAGGIAKGYTIDEVFKVLKSFGIKNALVDGGGDIYFHRHTANLKNWTIRLPKYGHHSTALKNGAIAVSGDTYKYLEWNGKRYSHIIDPRTGFGVEDSQIITVFAPNCMLADALASTLSVLKPSKRAKFIAQFENCRFY